MEQYIYHDYQALYKEINKKMNPDAYVHRPKNYPRLDDFDLSTQFEVIDYDKERIHDLVTNNAFIVGPPKGIKADLNDPDSIFSAKFGNTLKDLNPYIDRYRCNCGKIKSRIRAGELCKKCNSVCRYVDDNFQYCAYLVLKKHWIIHPNMYRKFERLLGKDELDNMIYFDDEKDQDGHTIKNKKQKKKRNKGKTEPYYGIGMIEFYKRFEEILEYAINKALKKNKNKQDLVDHILENKDKFFTQSVHVYTTHLRPVDANTTTLGYESTNAKYYMMSKLVACINDDSVSFRRKASSKNDLLYDLQVKWLSLYDDIVAIISTKKGNLRGVFGGRCNFSGRNVIVQNPTLDIDQITLSYFSLIELLQQKIINILRRTYNISPEDAKRIWWKANIVPDKRVISIIESLIRNSYYGLGLPCILNRNPTLKYGSIIQVFVVGMTFDYTIGLPLRSLILKNADFDGDAENIYYIVDKEFLELCFMVFNPRNAMIFSRNDGKFEPATNNQRDTIINANTLMKLCRSRYTKEQLDKINNIKDRLV